MKHSIVIFVQVSIFFCIGLSRADGFCATNEIASGCGPVCEPTCKNPNPQVCIAPCIIHGCRCKEGFLRDENTNRCVTSEGCNKTTEGVAVVNHTCGANAAPTRCGPSCEPTCENPNPSFCIMSCIVNGCRCNDGFLRDRNTGLCVRGERCTGLSSGIVIANQSCGANAAPAACGAICEPTCYDYNPQNCEKSCIKNGCRCNVGFLRDDNTGLCVKSDQCSDYKSGAIAIDRGCGPYGIIAPCGPVCEPTCNNPNPQPCPGSCIKNGCRCMDGSLRDGDTGLCTPPEDCTRLGLINLPRPTA